MGKKQIVQVARVALDHVELMLIAEDPDSRNPYAKMSPSAARMLGRALLAAGDSEISDGFDADIAEGFIAYVDARVYSP